VDVALIMLFGPCSSFLRGSVVVVYIYTNVNMSMGGCRCKWRVVSGVHRGA
jgi:hypothetical protein